MVMGWQEGHPSVNLGERESDLSWKAVIKIHENDQR